MASGFLFPRVSGALEYVIFLLIFLCWITDRVIYMREYDRFKVLRSANGAGAADPVSRVSPNKILVELKSFDAMFPLSCPTRGLRLAIR